jgi:hypothetical protein
MKSARVVTYALSLLICASSAAYAQGGGDKKGGPPDDKHGGQAKPANPGHDRENKAPPPAHAQPAARQQRAQTPPPARAKASPRSVAQPAPVQRQRAQQSSVSRVGKTPAAARVPAATRITPRPVVLPANVQRQRAQVEQQRAVQYRQRLAQQVNFSQQQAALLQQQKRINQYRAEQQYLAQLRQQQLQLQAARNWSNDPYIRTAPSYRYAYSGVTRETNQYGADVLRQAVNDGYQEGVRFGQADRADGYPANYTNNPAYRDANYGYSGYYVDQADYNYYFRQGFQRGYTDGYYSRSQYGSSLSGQPSILATLLTSILGLTSLR